jgi:hypothetical protein
VPFFLRLVELFVDPIRFVAPRRRSYFEVLRSTSVLRSISYRKPLKYLNRWLKPAAPDRSSVFLLLEVILMGWRTLSVRYFVLRSTLIIFFEGSAKAEKEKGLARQNRTRKEVSRLLY